MTYDYYLNYCLLVYYQIFEAIFYLLIVKLMIPIIGFDHFGSCKSQIIKNGLYSEPANMKCCMLYYYVLTRNKFIITRIMLYCTTI